METLSKHLQKETTFLLSCFFSRAFLIRATAEWTKKSYSFIFSMPLATVLCMKMEGFECVSMPLRVCRLLQYFLIPSHKGGNQFPSPPPS